MLFNTQAQFIAFADSTSGINYNAIKPSIRQAHLKYLAPVISQTLLDDLDEKHTDNAATGKDAKLIEKLQHALASLTLYLYAPITEVSLSDEGIRRGHSEQQPGAFKYQVQEYREAVLDRGFEALEDAIRYLIANAGDFTLWTESKEYASMRLLFIQTGDELAELYTGVKYPRRLFMLLRSTMYNVQELVFKPALGEVYTDILSAITESTDPDFSEQQEILFEKLKRSLAHYTIAKGLPTLLATMDENGIHVLTNTIDATNAKSKRTAAPDNHLAMIIDNASTAGAEWFSQAIDYLNTTATEDIFPSWYAKLQAEAEATAPLDNSTYSGLFSM